MKPRVLMLLICTSLCGTSLLAQDTEQKRELAERYFLALAFSDSLRTPDLSNECDQVCLEELEEGNSNLERIKATWYGKYLTYDVFVVHDFMQFHGSYSQIGITDDNKIIRLSDIGQIRGDNIRRSDIAVNELGLYLKPTDRIDKFIERTVKIVSSTGIVPDQLVVKNNRYTIENDIIKGRCEVSWVDKTYSMNQTVYLSWEYTIPDSGQIVFKRVAGRYSLESLRNN